MNDMLHSEQTSQACTHKAAINEMLGVVTKAYTCFIHSREFAYTARYSCVDRAARCTQSTGSTIPLVPDTTATHPPPPPITGLRA